MLRNFNFIKKSIILIFSIYVFLYIYGDETHYSFHTTLAMLPLVHGLIQLLSSRNWTVLEEIIRVLYFFRNVLTPYLIAKAHYNISLFSVPTNSEMLLTLFLFATETLCVYIYLWKVIIPRQLEIELSLKHKIPYNLFFWSLFTFLIFLYFIVPSAKDTFSPLWDEESMIKMALAEEDKATGLQRILETLFGIIFGIFRILLPAYFLVLIKKWVRFFPLAITLSLIVILTQVFVVTAQSMSTLTNLALLSMLLITLYPRKRKSLVLVFGGGFLVMIILVVAMKFSQANDNSGSDYTIIASMFQAYIPGVYNMQGVYKMPYNGLAVLFSDIYNTIPFRNTILPIKVVDNTVEIYRDVNDAGGQIIPLVGQGYYHFSFLAPLLSVLMIHISVYGWRKAYEKNSIGYLRYLYFTYLAYFAAMTPCLYFFSVFGQTFLTGIIAIYLMSIINEKRKTKSKNLRSDGSIQRREISTRTD